MDDEELQYWVSEFEGLGLTEDDIYEIYLAMEKDNEEAKNK